MSDFGSPLGANTGNGRAPDEGHQGSGLAGGQTGNAFKLVESAQDPLRAVNAPHLVAFVRAEAVFINGKLIERPPKTTQSKPA